MTRPTIRGLQDLLKPDIQEALVGGGVDLPIETGEGQENLTFKGTRQGDTLTAMASLAGLSSPTFSGLKQIIKSTSFSALAKAAPKAELSTEGTRLTVSISKDALSQIDLAVDPHLSRLLGDPGLPEGLTLSSAKVALTLDPPQKGYTFTCDVEGEWTIAEGFSAGDLGLKVAGTTAASPTLSLDAHLSLAGVGIALSAERASGSEKQEGQGDAKEEGDAAPAAAWKLRGELAEGQKIQLGGLLKDVGDKLKLPLPSFGGDVAIDKLAVDFDTGTKELSFTSDSEALGAVDLAIGAGEKSVVFTYHSPAGSDVDLKGLVSGVYGELGSIMPAMRVSLKDAVFVRTGGETSKLLFGLDLGGGIDLSNLSGLPIVGSALAGHEIVKLSYQILVSSDAFKDDEVKALQKQLGDRYTTVPATIQKGVNLAASLKFGEETEKVELPISLAKDGGSDPVQTDESKSGAHWFKLQKSFGPVHLEQVGVAYQKGELEILLQASMALGGLSLSLDGLGVSSPLSHLSPTFHLDGLGIAYKQDPLEIGGALRRREVKEGDTTFTEYDGAAVLQTDLKGQKLALHAIASYASYKDHPSLFLYAFLDYPLGGPPFLFVEGLAAGFGFNRSLKVPEIDGIAEFPLVKEAVEGQGPDTTDTANLAKTLTGELDKLDEFIKPHVGAGFLAIGIKFTSFKMLDSFALLTVELGDRFEMDLLGVSDLKIPTDAVRVPGVEPVAELRMLLKGSFVPAEGFLGLIGTLDKSSYILSKQCSLTGGRALYTWFAGEHAGDFAITMGGYHPSFAVPSHYPTVPRLGFNWKVDDKIVIKGESYFALCSHALMAGGHLEASYRAGKVHASFTAGADFLISWHPYHYDIHVSASISAGYGIFSAHLGADLHLWGPRFGGKAKIKIVVIKVTISFGDQGSASQEPMGWTDFQSAFLPEPSKRCGVTVQSGLTRKVKDTYVVNPKQFSLVTDAFFPTTEACVGSTEQKDVQYTRCGIRPMGVAATELASQQTINITYPSGSQQGDGAHCESWFTVTPVRKKAPSGIWGEPKLDGKNLQPPGVNEPRFVTGGGQDPVSGFQIVPRDPPKPGHTVDVARTALQYATRPVEGFGGWETLPSFAPSTSDEAARRQALRKTIKTNPKRSKILRALGYDPAEDVHIDPVALDASLVIAPQVA